MTQNDLIQKLSRDLKPVRPQKSFGWRLSFLLLICTLIACFGVYFWFVKKSEFHLIEGRTLLEGFLLFLTFIISAVWGTKSASPNSSVPKSSKKPLLFLILWLVVLGVSFLMLFLENSSEALIALKYNTWLCPMVILTIAIPSFVFSLFYFFKGAVLYSLQAFLYSSVLAMSLGALGLSFICPWTDPLHEILWHVAPVFLFIGIATLPLSFVFSKMRTILTAHPSAKSQHQ